MPTTFRLSDTADLPLRLDPAIRNQALRVYHALRAAIVDGLLAPGTQLPSTRVLGAQLAIGRNTIVAAYEHLLSDGLLEARHGSGTYVASHLPPPPPEAPAVRIHVPSAMPRPFALGQTHVEPVLLSGLAAAARRHIADAHAAELSYGDPRGSPNLRHRIAEFLAISRGIRCDPAHIIVVSGTQHGLRLCADALLSRGDAVWFEDPGYGVSRATLSAAGARPVPVPVDSEGLDIPVGIAREPRAKAIYVTPSHQFPTGVTLSMARRVALLDWAERSGAWVFEDDYDSEFRYSGPPLTALAGLSPGRVIYIGTFAKTLFPALRIGYLALPPAVLDPVLWARAAIDRFPPAFMQDALADLMANGAVARHLRRARRRYRDARDLVAGILRAESGGVLQPTVPEQGLHMIVRLRRGLGSQAGAAIREKAKVEAILLSEVRTMSEGDEGLIVGFSGYGADTLAAAAKRLAAAARTVAAM
jgi:GntR family transcriptional regulator/MocR family aminotransferase